MKKNKNGWEIVSSRTVHKNPWYSVNKDDVIESDGRKGQYFTVRTGASVFIVSVKDDKIIFVRQYRYVLDKWTLELPGGGVDAVDTPLIAAKKELHEEVGYISDDIEVIGTFIPMSGIVDEISHVFLARDVEHIGQNLESTETGAKVVEIPISKVYDMVDAGEIEDGQTIAALCFARKYLL